MKRLDEKDVEELKRQILAQKTTEADSRINFRIDGEIRNIANMLFKSYSTEVESRGRKTIVDKDSKEHVMQFAKFLCKTENSDKRGVLMCGSCGNGKTTLVYAFQNLVNALVNKGYYEKERKANGGYLGLCIVTAKDLCWMAVNDPKDYKAKMAYPMLAIDDLGEEPAEMIVFGNSMTPVIDVIEYRYQKDLFTLATSNLSTKMISKKYGVRVRDRLKAMMQVISFENESYRENAN